MRVILLLLLFVNHLASYAQMDTLYVSADKTSYLVFRDTVEFADVGTKGFKAVPRDKMVMLKADNKYSQQPTSLMVKTYSSVNVWILAYKANPPQLLYKIGVDTKEQKKISKLLNTEEKTMASIDKKPELSLPVEKEQVDPPEAPTPAPRKTDNKNRNNNFRAADQGKLRSIYVAKLQYRDIAEKDNNILFQLKNIFVDDKYLYLKIYIENNSSISYEIGLVHGEYIKTNNSTKRSKVAGGVDYSYIYEDAPKVIEPDKGEIMIYAFPLYAFEEKDKIDISISEEGGKRGLSFRIPAKEINLAIRLK